MRDRANAWRASDKTESFVGSTLTSAQTTYPIRDTQAAELVLGDPGIAEHQLGSQPPTLTPTRVPQPLHVAQGWKTEEALVLTAEMGSVLVPHTVGCGGGVEILAQHQPARLLQPQPFLVLQGAQRRDGRVNN